MYWEAMRTPALPGEYDVTDGSVDYYDTDWENVDNSALEEEMQKCGLTPCEGKTMCPDNTPALEHKQTCLRMRSFLNNGKPALPGVGLASPC